MQWRWADKDAGPHRPEPWWAARAGEVGGWRSQGGEDVDRVGFDDQGRPVLVEEHCVYADSPDIEEVWEHGDGEWRLLSRWRMGGLRATLVFGPPGRVETVVWSERGGEEIGVECWSWRDGAPVRGDCADAAVDGWASGTAYDADVDERGELVRLRRGVLGGDIREETRLPPESVVDALVDALRAASSIVCDADVWRAELHRSEPELRSSPELVDVLAAGVGGAVRAAVEAAGVERPFVVKYRLSPRDEGPEMPLPGFVRIGSERFRDRMRTFSSVDGEALDRLVTGEESGEVALVELAGHCDSETLRACREVNTAIALWRDFDDPDKQRALAALDALAARLAGELNGEAGFAGIADPFLVVVEVADPLGGDGLLRARRALGPARVERFVASLASAVEAAQAADVDLAGARQDRDVLAGWLRARGLGEHARTIAHEAARPAFRLTRDGEGSRPGSRIGGTGLLPPGAPWPRTAAGRPLSFLAGVDLGELPHVLAGTEVLPEAGWLLFFADLNDEGEALGFIGEPTLNEEGADARVLWLAPGSDPVEAEPPADLPRESHVRLPERRVTARFQLTLEDSEGSGESLGLDATESVAYDEIACALRGDEPSDDDDSDWEAGDWEAGDWEAGDWVLGAVTGVQGLPPEAGTVLLLHLGSIEFSDAGAIQFRIPEAALEARDWSQICAEGDSC